MAFYRFCTFIGSIITQYLQSLDFYEEKYETLIKFNLLFKFNKETPERTMIPSLGSAQF